MCVWSELTTGLILCRIRTKTMPEVMRPRHRLHWTRPTSWGQWADCMYFRALHALLVCVYFMISAHDAS